MLRDPKRPASYLLVLVLAAMLSGSTNAGVFGEGDVTELRLAIANAGAVARGSFPGARGERIFVRFAAHDFGSGCTETASVAVVAQDGRIVASKSALCAGGDHLDTFELPADGSYELVVDPFGASTGSVTASVFRVPHDVRLHDDYLYPLGEPHSFELSVPGQNAALTVDLTPGARVLYRFAGNTITAGCAEPLTARLADPSERVLASTRLCTGRETIAFTAIGDGIHTLTLDPPGPRTGTIVVTLFLDQPDVTPVGEFAEETSYITGSRSYGVTVEAAYRRGIARLWVARAGAGAIASTLRCRRLCPARRTLRTTIETRHLPEGRHVYFAEAAGTDGRSSGVADWSIYVDRTPQRPPKRFRVETYDPVKRTAEFGWCEGSDPYLPDGEPGAGPERSDYRLRRGQGAWSPWRRTDVPFFDVGRASPGDVFHLRVRGYDAAGNRSAPTYARLRVTGSEPSEPPFERDC